MERSLHHTTVPHYHSYNAYASLWANIPHRNAIAKKDKVQTILTLILATLCDSGFSHPTCVLKVKKRNIRKRKTFPRPEKLKVIRKCSKFILQRRRYSWSDSVENGLKIVSNSKRFPKSIIKDILIVLEGKNRRAKPKQEECQEFLITTVANERKW